jgi:hypothetical protein
MGLLGRKAEQGPGPSAKHKFVGPEDNRIALMQTAFNPDFTQAAQLSMAGASLRKYPCQVSGCGKGREDPIHQL